jgi:cystathionine beta-lyase/cystathionine gamma-synthase
MEPDSLLAHGLFANPSGGLSPELDRSTTFERWPPAPPFSPYGRSLSPTAAAAEKLLGALEDAQALVFASGMTAWSTLCLTVLEPGAALVIPDTGYYGTNVLAGALLERFGVEVRRVPAEDGSAFAAACQGAALALVESPANPQLTVVDIAAAAQAAHAGGALLVADNTVGTPLLQRPLDLGADVTWQSATKHLAGHSDVLAGVLATRDGALADRVRRMRSELGGLLSPDGSWLLLRGLRSLVVRHERQCATALELARRLAAHPTVQLVRYPGLPDHPGHELASRQMRGAFGGLLAFELADAAAAERFEGALRLARRATSLGSVETLVERRGRIEPEGRVAPGLLRVSTGLEHVDDLWADFEQALGAVG